MERTYTIPLRRGFQKAPKYKRAKKAVAVLRAFIAKHMKVTEDEVRIGQHLNEHLWEKGMKHPPPRVKVTTKKVDDIVTVEREGQEYASVVKPQAVQEEPQGMKEKLQAAIGGKKDAKDEQNEAANPEKQAAPKKEATPSDEKPAEKDKK
ncbi:MAG: 50S ribosomal protein L31e [Candidatus Woesearchaeota archaeon]|nr:50S ribosomal protein L31e [Candidatus Woesearchaeota archaeon]